MRIRRIDDSDIEIALACEQAGGSGDAGGPAADNDDVVRDVRKMGRRAPAVGDVAHDTRHVVAG